jgi:hypothetical protein
MTCFWFVLYHADNALTDEYFKVLLGTEMLTAQGAVSDAKSTRSGTPIAPE